MNNKETQYHAKRRPFIIFPDMGVLFAGADTALSHNDMLKSLDFDTGRTQHIMDNFPRGYYMDKTLVFYQGYSMKEGDTWKIRPENIPVIKRYFSDLESFFNLDDKTSIYLGVQVGKIGDTWKPINKVSFDKIKGTTR